MNALIVHPQFSKIGGAEKVSLKIIEILVSKFKMDVTILSTTPIDKRSVELHTGYKIDLDKINSEIVNMPAFMKNRFFHTRMALLHRRAKALAPSYSFLVSTYNEIDFKNPAIQYVHHVMLPSDEILSKYHLASALKFPFNYLSFIYRNLNNLIAKRDFSNIKKNITATNSLFIDQIYKEIYSQESKVIYPSLVENEKLQTGIKEKQILTISRFSPNKNIPTLFHVFDEIHQMNPTFKFVIAGQIESLTYFKKIKTEADCRNYNIEILTNCSRNRIIELYQESEYYINPKEYEHFGIAVLEAMKYGCIPIVHQSGGSVELIPFKELQFQNVNEIKDIIISVESSQSLKKNLIQRVKSHSNSFSEKVFENEISKLIENYLSQIDKHDLYSSSTI